jgi:hypothetical protein
MPRPPDSRWRRAKEAPEATPPQTPDATPEAGGAAARAPGNPCGTDQKPPPAPYGTRRSMGEIALDPTLAPGLLRHLTAAEIASVSSAPGPAGATRKPFDQKVHFCQIGHICLTGHPPC